MSYRVYDDFVFRDFVEYEEGIGRYRQTANSRIDSLDSDVGMGP